MFCPNVFFYLKNFQNFENQNQNANQQKQKSKKSKENKKEFKESNKSKNKMAPTMEIDFGFGDLEVSEAAEQTALTMYNKHYLGGLSGAAQRKVIEKVGEKMDERDEQVTTTLDTATKYVENATAAAARGRDGAVRRDVQPSKNTHFIGALDLFNKGVDDMIVFNRKLTSGGKQQQVKAAIGLSNKEVDVDGTKVNVTKLFVDIVRKICKGDGDAGPLRTRTNEPIAPLSTKMLKVKKFYTKAGKERFERDEKGEIKRDDDGKKILRKHEREVPVYEDNIYGTDGFDKSKEIVKHGETEEKEINGEIYFMTSQQRWKLVPAVFHDEPSEEISNLAEVYFKAMTAWGRSMDKEEQETLINRNKVAQGNPLGTMIGGKPGKMGKNQEAVLRWYKYFFANAPELEDIALKVNRAIQLANDATTTTEQLGSCTESFETIGSSATIMKKGLDGAVKQAAKKKALAVQGQVERQASLRSHSTSSSTTNKRERDDGDEDVPPSKQKKLSVPVVGGKFRGKGDVAMERLKEAASKSSDDESSDGEISEVEDLE
jgi:hypothetical protein